MPDVQHESGSSLSRLLDAIEEKLEIGRVNAAMAEEIDNVIERIPAILRRIKKAKNCLTPINWLPSEIFAHVAVFFPRKRDLINATAVCQHWRTTLLSFPLLWRDASGSSSEIQAYIERSGSAPLSVNLSRTSSVDLLAPHTSRLVGLTVKLSGPLAARQLVKDLPHPIPTLHTLNIYNPQSSESVLEFPPDLTEPFFLYAKKLELKEVLVIRGPQAFHNVTDLTLDSSRSEPIDYLLETLKNFPILERVAITLHEDLFAFATLPVVTLPYVQEMSVSTPRDGRNRTYLPGILVHLQLPKLTSLRVQVPQGVVPAHPFFPFSALHNHLQNFIELPELQVDINVRSREVAFRSASQAIIEYSAEYLADYKSVERENWRGLPLRSVRRLTVNMVSRPSFAGLRWFFDLLEDLKCLEHLELGGVCNFAVD